jgi:hypothetical protein
MRVSLKVKDRLREEIPACQLDRYLTQRLHRVPGFDFVDVSAGYRLNVPDSRGCNWSGNVVLMHGLRAPHPDRMEAALRPIVRAARARFNMSE